MQEGKGEKKVWMKAQEMWAPFWHQYRIPLLPWASNFEIQSSVCKMGAIEPDSNVGRISPLIFMLCLGTSVPGTFIAILLEDTQVHGYFGEDTHQNASRKLAMSYLN